MIVCCGTFSGVSMVMMSIEVLFKYFFFSCDFHEYFSKNSFKSIFTNFFTTTCSSTPEAIFRLIVSLLLSHIFPRPRLNTGLSSKLSNWIGFEIKISSFPDRTQTTLDVDFHNSISRASPRERKFCETIMTKFVDSVSVDSHPFRRIKAFCTRNEILKLGAWRMKTHLISCKRHAAKQN